MLYPALYKNNLCDIHHTTKNPLFTSTLQAPTLKKIVDWIVKTTRART